MSEKGRAIGPPPMAFVLHLRPALMPSRLVRIIAVCLIVLGASPFTAPFSTIDWATFTGHNQSRQPAGDQSPHGAVVKTATDPDQAPVLAATAALAMPLFSIVPNETVVRALGRQ